MKKIALLMVAAVALASPAMAKKAKKAKKAKAEPTVAQLNDNGYRFVRDSLPIYYPTIVKFMIYNNPETKKKK
jgi:hypothetical protein